MMARRTSMRPPFLSPGVVLVLVLLLVVRSPSSSCTSIIAEVHATSIVTAEADATTVPPSSSSLQLAALPWGGKPCAGTHHGCLPSFLIIGAGKSGTSSLYYYLQEHPAVEAAAHKQVQFFDHQFHRGLPWYLSHFPRKMADGHVTGEASPGYIVYSRVPPLVLSTAPQARIIALVREPLDRFWSSYHYNYLDVLAMHGGGGGGRHGKHGSRGGGGGGGGFAVAAPEHFASVEIAILEACFAEHAYSPRVGTGGGGGGTLRTAPLDVTETCINRISHTDHLSRIRLKVAATAAATAATAAGTTTPRASPSSSIFASYFSSSSSSSSSRVAASRAGDEVEFPASNSHLFRQFVSRGLYSLMLEHWFAAFPADQIAIVCTEALSANDEDQTKAASPFSSSPSSAPPPSPTSSAALAVSRVAAFIGLDPAQAGHFEAAVARGKFNAAARRGYEAVTPWEAARASEAARPAMEPALRAALVAFYAPFNERLFELAGGRCRWPVPTDRLTD